MHFGKKWSFFSFSFLGKSSRKRTLFDIRDRKNFSKRPQNRNFPKGLVHEIWPKMAIFLICTFWAKPVTKDRFLIFFKEKNDF